MEKELFVKTIEEMEKQYRHDREFAHKMAELFPEAHGGNLFYANHFLSNALLEVLSVAMGDEKNAEPGTTWIEHFCFELDFGKENNRLKVWDDQKKEVPMSNPGELWEFLKKGRK